MFVYCMVVSKFRIYVVARVADGKRKKVVIQFSRKGGEEGAREFAGYRLKLGIQVLGPCIL
jgi:hypothetical protein